MGISYSAYAVFGFKLNIEAVNKKKTKYNEDTGEPYQVEIPSYNVALVNGVRVADTKYDADSLYVGEKIEGLEIVQSGYEEGTKALGVIVAKVCDLDDFVHIDTNMPPVVQAFADRYSLTPGLFLIQSCG